jgi:hypothetical protein
MKGLRRWLFDISGLLLLLLFAVFLWIVLTNTGFRDLFNFDHGTFSCFSLEGRTLRIVHHTGGFPAHVNLYNHRFLVPFLGSFTHFGGFTIGYGPYEYYWLEVDLYHVLPLLAAFLLTMAYLRHRRKNAASTAGHCVSCGYDLCATPTRCPECGTVPKSWRPDLAK